jgi:hypothetical protein
MDGAFVLRIAATPAEVFLHFDHDIRFGGGGILFQGAANTHDHARGAVTALKRAFVHEHLLDRMQFVAAGEAFDGDDLRFVEVADGSDARGGAFTVYEYGAGAALAFAAAELGAGELKVFAQDFEQGTLRVGGDGPGLAVQDEADLGIHNIVLKMLGQT